MSCFGRRKSRTREDRQEQTPLRSWLLVVCEDGGNGVVPALRESLTDPEPRGRVESRLVPDWLPRATLDASRTGQLKYSDYERSWCGRRRRRRRLGSTRTPRKSQETTEPTADRKEHLPTLFLLEYDSPCYFQPLSFPFIYYVSRTLSRDRKRSFHSRFLPRWETIRNAVRSRSPLTFLFIDR